jgi:hypothetical protein
MIPLISTSASGPLGILHLPRLWLKLLLHKRGLLPVDYGYGYRGFDKRLADMLGIDRDAMIVYVEDESPDYLMFEKWIVAHATALTPTAIAAFNESVRAQAMFPERIEAIHAHLGVTDSSYQGAVALNDLDDWSGIHAELTGRG